MVNELKELDRQYIQLKAFLMTVIEHQEHDQQRITNLENAQGSYNQRMIDLENLNRRAMDHIQAQQKLIAELQALLQDVKKGKKKQKEITWVESDAELDTQMRFNVNSEFKSQLLDISKGLDLTMGSLIRQFIVRGVPELQDSIGPVYLRSRKDEESKEHSAVA
jgi:chromosome segregation ATPase